ncbi:MAG: AAA family ATPase [bacterium]
MLTKLTIRNFKRFDEVEIELGDPVVFIGPNNWGKTTALQALALWEVGLKRWIEKRGGKKQAKQRSGVAINRRDVFAIPLPDAILLWRNLHVRDVKMIQGKPDTKNINIDVIVKGIGEKKEWECGLEFDYANEQSFYCRPLRVSDGKNPDRMPIPEEAVGVNLAFLPPMSGLAANEISLEPGTVNVRIGEGRTAEVLRNLCYRVYEGKREKWELLVNLIKYLFGSELDPPQYIKERGEITMNYREGANRLDLSSSGKGLQQTLLLLSYMYTNPGSIILLDEPDAHLEILRQRQIYQLLIDVARENGNQVIAASHSEVLLQEAVGRDVVVSFVGKPHTISDRVDQTRKSLKEIGYEDYYQAEQTGWVFYLEGSTDLAILRELAKLLNHKEAVEVLERPFIKYIGNLPNKAKDHFYGLREAVPNLRGIALFDRLDTAPQGDANLKMLMWKCREIENYLNCPETLDSYVRDSVEKEEPAQLFAQPEKERRLKIMHESVQELVKAYKTARKGSPWDSDFKASDDFLTPLFENYYQKLGLPNMMAKKNFHELARFVPKEKINPEVREKLDAIVEVAKRAKPANKL